AGKRRRLDTAPGDAAALRREDAGEAEEERRLAAPGWAGEAEPGAGGEGHRRQLEDALPPAAGAGKGGDEVARLKREAAAHAFLKRASTMRTRLTKPVLGSLCERASSGPSTRSRP